MIKRKSRAWVAKLMKQNSNWNILDLGGGPDAWEQAKTVLDYVDYSEKYKDRRFVQGDATNTPFKDKEFDFVICTHVIEHVVDPELSLVMMENYHMVTFGGFGFVMIEKLFHLNQD
jgi:predicted SAM-dependent methyltransferase